CSGRFALGPGSRVSLAFARSPGTRWARLAKLGGPAYELGLEHEKFWRFPKENRMKLCRFDEDRRGVVVGNMVHDVTAAQDEIRKTARYDMKGDAVIAALPAWRQRIEEMAAKASGKPLSGVRLISPVARPSKTMAAPTNYKK